MPSLLGSDAVTIGDDRHVRDGGISRGTLVKYADMAAMYIDPQHFQRR